jgi:hypothetical protein
MHALHGGGPTTSSTCGDLHRTLNFYSFTSAFGVKPLIATGIHGQREKDGRAQCRLTTSSSMWQRGHYVSTIAEFFIADSAFDNGGIPD